MQGTAGSHAGLNSALWCSLACLLHCGGSSPRLPPPATGAQSVLTHTHMQSAIIPEYTGPLRPILHMCLSPRAM